jgi:hypothetical protein
MKQTNVANITPHMVETIDGRVVDSNSDEWRRCCEAVHILGMQEDKRKETLRKIESKRGERGRKAVDEEMARVGIAFEAARVLAMPEKEMRQQYLARVERSRGSYVAEEIKRHVVRLWGSKKLKQGEKTSV